MLHDFKLEYPTYDVVTPISRTKVKFRPFIVKEQKTLLLQVRAGEPVDMINKVIEACATYDGNMLLAEKEWLFLHIRAKSVGEEIELAHTCANCGTKNYFNVNLESDPKFSDNETVEASIQAAGITVGLEEPARELVSAVYDRKTRSVEALNEMLADMISYLVNGEKKILKQDMTKEDRLEFVEGLINKDFERMEDWFLKLPKLYLEKSYTCSKCGTVNEIYIEGAESFFA